MVDSGIAQTRVVLIRHGESASNAGGWLSGQETCGGLTELGVTQAEALRDRLAIDPAMQPDRVVVSTMRRAVHTAEIAASPTGLTVEQFPDLMERTSGEAEGPHDLRVHRKIRQGAVDGLVEPSVPPEASRVSTSPPE